MVIHKYIKDKCIHLFLSDISSGFLNKNINHNILVSEQISKV